MTGHSSMQGRYRLRRPLCSSTYICSPLVFPHFFPSFLPFFPLGFHIPSPYLVLRLFFFTLDCKRVLHYRFDFCKMLAFDHKERQEHSEPRQDADQSDLHPCNKSPKANDNQRTKKCSEKNEKQSIDT